MVSRRNLAGVISRMERDGHLQLPADPKDRRSRLVHMTAGGRELWLHDAQPKIRAYYDKVLAEFSMGDIAHALHYMLKLLENMKRIDGNDPAQADLPE